MLQVYTNTDEADVGRIQVGAPATFRVDTFPREYVLWPRRAGPDERD